MNRSAALPIILICLGSVWFLKSTSLLPDTSTLLTLLLTAAGIVLLIIDGFNKSTLITSPLLVYAGGAIYLYDHYGLYASHLVSLGMVLAGLLMLIARSPQIPERSRKYWPKQDND
ncbi:hypothetical protein HZU77_004415 [Neisseriaceae bacterium TC5R-5]|nr:hypothetical protein [Neisseriaceae bacterium TC5R-5]